MKYIKEANLLDEWQIRDEGYSLDKHSLNSIKIQQTRKYIKEANLLDSEGALLSFQIHPGVVAVRAFAENVTMSVHDGLDNGSVGSDTNSCSDHYGML